MDKRQIIQQLKACLAQSCSSMISNNVFGDYNWTENIKKSLGEVGRMNGFNICASTTDKDFDSEWLYDLVWYKENNEGFLIEVPLVVESEWKKNLIKEVKFDFEKLLLARSSVRLMICNCDESQKTAFLQYFQKAIDVCPLVTKDDSFLIAILLLESGDALRFDFFELQKS